jgi:hypothetical protein
VKNIQKKIMLGLVAVLLFTSILGMAATPVMAHTEEDPFLVDLIAGGGNEKSAIDVGDVLVWNDAETLFVQYSLIDGWCLIETHLDVKASAIDIPQTKKGNPIPGHFTYSSEHELDPCTTEKTYPIPIEWEFGDEISIAAHAVVIKKKTECLVSESGIDVYGPISAYAPLGDSSWGTEKDSVATWVHPSWPSMPDATWISTDYYVEEAVDDSWRWFHDEIVLPDNCLSGTLVFATSDNAEEIYFNNVLIGSDGEVQGPFIDNHEWGTIIEYSITPEPGVNYLDFIVRNYAQPGGVPTSNPTGLIYKTCFEYCLEETEETAWGDGDTFNDKNWATYFPYTLQAPNKFWNLPEHEIQILTIFPGTMDTYFDIQLFGVGIDYDITDGTWNGWCADSDISISSVLYFATAYSSYDPNLPWWAKNDEQWDFVNYILNNKHPEASWQEIQAAIWYFTDEFPDYKGYDTGFFQAMVDDALANGAGFQPMPGQIGAVILAIEPCVQLVFIEVDP